MTGKLAILGGPKAVTLEDGDLFDWPIITAEDEEAVMTVLRARGMSNTDVTQAFEAEFAAWHDLDYALAFNNGTAALHTAMWACGVRRGDEVIAPGMTFWASCTPAMSLGATVVFADIERDTLCLDPNDIEHRITDRTRAIIPVHFGGHPADMDPIMAIARRHGLKVIEDASHAHGALYKGRTVGTIGDVGCFSVMSRKALAIGEGGIFITSDREIYERGVLFADQSRHDTLTIPELAAIKGLPVGGVKYRMHQLSSAVGRVQLRHYRERMQEIQRAMNYFWDLLADVPGIKAHRPPADSGSTMGGWYASRGLYRAGELAGLPLERFCEAVLAEGTLTRPGANDPLHLQPLYQTIDVFGDGQPTSIAFADRDARAPAGSLPNAEAIRQIACRVPWFKHCRPQQIEQHAEAFRKVAEAADQLRGDGTHEGGPAG